MAKEAAQRWTGMSTSLSPYLFVGTINLMGTDNTLILMQYVKGMGVDESQIRETLGISKLPISGFVYQEL